jgi:flavodoxin
METLFIVYAPDSPENRKSVEEVRTACEAVSTSTFVKEASRSSITDIAGADIVLLGVRKSGGSEIPAEFGELLRASKGANLAGKTIAFFSFGSEKAAAKLRRALRDSDITQFDEEPLLADKDPSRSVDVKGWIDRIVSFHKGNRRAGE